MTKLPFASSPTRTEFTNTCTRAATGSRSLRKTNISVLPGGGVARQASCWACTGGAVPKSAASKRAPLTSLLFIDGSLFPFLVGRRGFHHHCSVQRIKKRSFFVAAAARDRREKPAPHRPT